MSPEQCEAGELDHRSDIYSLGATYYALLTGASPYENEGSFVQVLNAHCRGKLLDPRDLNPDIPEACSRIVSRAMAKRPEDRYQSAEEMLADLESLQANLSGTMLPSHSGKTSQTHQVQPTSTVSRRLLFAGAAVVVAGVLAAGAFLLKKDDQRGDSLGLGSGDLRNLSTPVAPDGAPIKVGVLNSLSGSMAVSGSAAIEATLLAIDEVNEAGGVLGRPLEAVVRDTRSDVENFAPLAEKLITEDQVGVIFGCWTSSGRKMVVPIVEEHNALLIYPRLYEGIEESPNVFYLGATPNQQMIPAVKWAFETLQKRRFFMVGSDYVFPRIANEILKDQIRELGTEVIGEEYRPMGSTDFQSIVAKIVAVKPDCILNTLSGDSNVHFFRELRAAGIHSTDIPTVSFSIGEEELQQLDVEQIIGDYSACCYFQSIDTAENQQFVSAFRKKFGPQRVVTDPMEAAYMSVKLWAAAVQEAQSFETPAVRQAMRGLRLPSPAGQLRIDSSTQHAYKLPRIGRITGSGQFEIVWTASQPVAPEPYVQCRSAEEWRAELHDLQRSWNDQWAAPQE